MESVIKITRKHDIVVHSNGQIDLGKRVIRELDLHVGDIVDICYERFEHYLYCKRRHDQLVGSHHAQCLSTHRGRGLRVYSVQLTKHIFSSMQCTQPTLRLAVGETTDTEVGTALPIILKPL